jgi:hypothetical protein
VLFLFKGSFRAASEKFQYLTRDNNTTSIGFFSKKRLRRYSCQENSFDSVYIMLTSGRDGYGPFSDARGARKESSVTDDLHPEFLFPVKIEGDESAVPAEFRGIYRKDPNDGSMHMIPGLAKQVDNSGLKVALHKARDDARHVEKREKDKHKATLALIGAETPEEVPLKIEELRRAGSGAIDAARAEVENRYKQTYSAQLEQQKLENQKLKKTLQETLIDGEAGRAIAAHKGSQRALMPHVRASMKLVEEDGALRPRVIDAEGHVRYSDDGRPLGVSDLLAEMKQDRDFANLFEGSGSSGSGAFGGSRGGAGGGSMIKSYSLADWKIAMAKAKPDERAQMMRDKAAGKIKVAD